MIFVPDFAITAFTESTPNPWLSSKAGYDSWGSGRIKKRAMDAACIVIIEQLNGTTETWKLSQPTIVTITTLLSSQQTEMAFRAHVTGILLFFQGAKVLGCIVQCSFLKETTTNTAKLQKRIALIIVVRSKKMDEYQQACFNCWINDTSCWAVKVLERGSELATRNSMKATATESSPDFWIEISCFYKSSPKFLLPGHQLGSSAASWKKQPLTPLSLKNEQTSK